MLKTLKILMVASTVVISGILALPVMTAGTPFPCEAVARIAAKKMKKIDLEEPWRTLAEEAAIRIGATYARNRGILACYATIPKSLKVPSQSTDSKFVRN